MNKENYIIWIISILILLLAFAGIGFVIYVYVTYSGTPLKDLPAWVLPFFIK